MTGVGILKIREKIFVRVSDEMHGRWAAPTELETAEQYAMTDNLKWTYLQVPAGYGRRGLGLPPTMDTMMRQPVFDAQSLLNEDLHPRYFSYAFRNDRTEYLAIWQIGVNQRTTSRLFLGGSAEGEARISFQQDGFLLPLTPDIVYDEQGRLYFRDVHKLKKLLPKTRGLLKEENRRKVQELTDLGMVALTGDLNETEVSMENLRRIPAAVRQIQHFSTEEKEIFKEYVDEIYEGEIEYDFQKQRYMVRTNKELKKLLEAALEMVYITRITKQYRVAKNAVPLKRNGK